MPSESERSWQRYPALSIRQPWAELIMAARKSIEIRTWSTDYRGPLWIHAGRARDVELDQRFGLSEPYRGGFIGRVTLSAVLQFDRDQWDRWRDRHLSDGSMPATAYGWILRNPIRLKEPVPAHGSLGLFKPDEEMSRLLQSLLPKL